MARRAYSLDKLLEEIDTLAPNRSKASDGWIGDAAHAARQSDHNPDKDGVVLAIDIGHDPNGGLDCNWLADALFSCRNTVINYVIWNKQIYIPFKRSWATEYGQKWQNYTGSNPHTKHLHISVNKSNSDNTAPWQIGGSMYQGRTAKDWHDTWEKEVNYERNRVEQFASDLNAERKKTAELEAKLKELAANEELVKALALVGKKLRGE